MTKSKYSDSHYNEEDIPETDSVEDLEWIPPLDSEELEKIVE